MFYDLLSSKSRIIEETEWVINGLMNKHYQDLLSCRFLSFEDNKRKDYDET